MIEVIGDLIVERLRGFLESKRREKFYNNVCVVDIEGYLLVYIGVVWFKL